MSLTWEALDLAWRTWLLVEPGAMTRYPTGRAMLWTACTVRKPCRCWFCREAIKAGERAWRPITNTLIRMERVCPACAIRRHHTNKKREA